MNPAIATPPPSTPFHLPRWLPLASAVALALMMFAWLVVHLAPATMSPDSNGYVVQARLLATTGTTHLTTGSPAQFVGIHWLETKAGVFHSRYPAGLPILFAGAWKLGGLPAALLVNPLLASTTVFLVFLLARRFSGEGSALLAAAVFATNATVQQHAFDADAHVATAFFLTAGILALLRFAENLSPARGLLAGLLLGIVPTLRYPEAIAGIAIGAWLLWRVRPLWRVWPTLVGAAGPFGALLIHNAGAYGAFWRTGYALTNEQTGFGWSYFAAHWLGYLHSLGGAGLGVFFAFGAAGLAGLVAEARHRATGVLLAGITVPLVLLYMAYYFGTGDGNLRFLVPTFPLLAVAGAWLLSRAATAGDAGRAVWVTVAVLQLLPAGAASSQMAARMQATLRAAAQARTTLEKQAPAGSVVVVERQLGESLDATGQWRLVDESLVGGLGLRGGPTGAMAPGLRRTGVEAGPGRRIGQRPAGFDPDQPNPQQMDKNRAQRARYDGLAPRERQARAWADLRAWAGEKPVYWYARSLDAVENALPEDADYESVAEIDAPAMMGPGGAGRGGMAGRGPGGPGGGRGPMMGGAFPPNAGGMRPPGMNPPDGGPGMAFSNPPGGPGAQPGGFPQNQKLRLVKITFAKTAAAGTSTP